MLKLLSALSSQLRPGLTCVFLKQSPELHESNVCIWCFTFAFVLNAVFSRSKANRNIFLLIYQSIYYNKLRKIYYNKLRKKNINKENHTAIFLITNVTITHSYQTIIFTYTFYFVKIPTYSLKKNIYVNTNTNQYPQKTWVVLHRLKRVNV